MTKAAHSYSTGLQPCAQKQLLQNIQDRGGIAAIIKSKKGALTSEILRSRELYGPSNSELRKSCTTKIGHWKQLYKKGEYEELVNHLLGNNKENQGAVAQTDSDSATDSDATENEDEDEDDDDNTPPKNPTKHTPKKTPKKTSKPSLKPSPKSTKKVLFREKPMGAREMVARKSMKALKEFIGEFSSSN